MSESLFGVLCVNKPDGMTSRDVVNKIQRLVKPAKCGHAGTLDPMATGVLLVCIGAATRLISLLQDTTKIYEADFLLGQRSNTDDSTGLVEYCEVPGRLPDLRAIQRCLNNMTGSVQQVPPAFSAVHVNGQRAYDLARKGQDVTLAAREVQIDRIEVLAYEWPQLQLRITCGSGTYVRSIARDLGQQLGVGGLMSRLVRTQVGRFDLENAVSLDQLSMAAITEHVQPASLITFDLPQYRCCPADRELLACGKTLTVSSERLSMKIRPHNYRRANAPSPALTQVALYGEQDGQLWAIADLTRSGQQLQPRLVLIKK